MRVGLGDRLVRLFLRFLRRWEGRESGFRRKVFDRVLKNDLIHGAIVEVRKVVGICCSVE